jgi:thiol-disulfide isomerase/thioredoxin
MPRIIASVVFAATVVAAAADPIGTLRFADAYGHTIALDAPGVLYLIDFWALECKPCMLEMPELERLAKEYETPSLRLRRTTHCTAKSCVS